MLIVMCPHCNEYISMIEVNCAIFRHGVFKRTFEQIPPHSTKQQCDEWVQTSQIYGCGKPFKLVDGNAVECDYI